MSKPESTAGSPDAKGNRLMHHQTAGVAYLQANSKVFLADDMGLGKTIQAIVAAVPPVLVVAPASMIYIWAAEFEKWRPRLDVQVLDDGVLDDSADVYIVTHGKFWKPAVWPQLHLRFGLPSSGKSTLQTLVVDEAHCFRNVSAKRTQHMMSSGSVPGPLVGLAKRVWALTGTPIVNSPLDLWTWMKTLRPFDTPESLSEWMLRYCELTPDRYAPSGVRPSGRVKNGVELRERLHRMMLRRKKSQVLVDLPAVRQTTVPLRPGTYPSGFVTFMQGLAKEYGDSILVNLKGCESPEAFLEGLIDRDYLATYARHMGMAKAVAVAELMKDELSASHCGSDTGLDCVVIFCKHLCAVEYLAETLDSFGVVTLTGAVSSKDRAKRVAAFQAEDGPRVFIGQITAAGVGITLTRACEAVFCELSWTPADNMQARDRLVRIGQERPVRSRVVTLAGNQMDELVTAALTRKMHSIEVVVD